MKAHGIGPKTYHRNGDVSFKTIGEFHRKLESLDCDEEWCMKTLERLKDAAEWVPDSIPFYYRDSLQALRSIVSNPRVAEYCKWEPQKFFDAKENRVYTDVFSGNWLWDRQVASPVPKSNRTDQY